MRTGAGPGLTVPGSPWLWGQRDSRERRARHSGAEESPCVPRCQDRGTSVRAVLCVCVRAVQAQLRKTIPLLVVCRLITVTKHRRKNWSFYYRDCKKILIWHAANSKEGSASEGKYECLGSSGCFSLHLEDICNVAVVVFDG